MKAEALRIFRAGLAAADPARAVTAELGSVPTPDLILALGKAARSMAEAALAHFGPRPCLVITNDENARALTGAAVLASSHPVPDARGLAAAETVERQLSRLSSGQHVLALISGGGSALLPAPVPGVSLEDKARVNRLLLASGAEITRMNLVRQQLSRLKGGGLLRAATPATVTALILSDVIGDDLRAIASGPTVAPLGSRAEAKAVLHAHGIWDDLPDSVRTHLSQPEPKRPDLPQADNRLIGSNTISVLAMAAAAPTARIDPAPLTGDVAAAAARIIAAPGGITLFGGETTVILQGKGRGGRNQELALRVALLAEAAGWQGPWCFLSAGTDGRDGPTDAAGAIVDQGTLARIRAAGLDAAGHLARNDSYPCLQASGDLLVIGGTGTNVADLQVLIRP